MVRMGNEVRMRAAMFVTVALTAAWQGIVVPGARAAEQAVHVTEVMTSFGLVDWTKGVITATGLGAPPKEAANALISRTMAKKAAQSVALRNLLEAVKGVRVDSTTTVNNYVTTNDEIRVKVEGVIEGARVIEEQELPDGNYKTTIEMKLGGELSNAVVPKPKGKPEKITGQCVKNCEPRAYTGLVVDARGTGALPALAPRIVNEDGAEAYSVTYVQEGIRDKGITAYVKDENAAQAHPRVTNRPLIVKALRATGVKQTDLVISNTDAQTLHGVPAHFKFLEKGQVIVVMEPQR